MVNEMERKPVRTYRPIDRRATLTTKWLREHAGELSPSSSFCFIEIPLPDRRVLCVQRWSEEGGRPVVVLDEAQESGERVAVCKTVGELMDVYERLSGKKWSGGSDG